MNMDPLIEKIGPITDWDKWIKDLINLVRADERDKCVPILMKDHKKAAEKLRSGRE